MRYVLLVALIAALVATSAIAAENPGCKIFVDFSGTMVDNQFLVSRIDTTPGFFDVWFGITDLTTVPGDGFTTISVAINADPDDLGISYENLLPGNLAIGAWSTGITLSSTDCLPGPLVYFAKAQVFYFGGAYDLVFSDHPDFPRWVVDCHDGVDFYCVWSHGGIGKDALPGDEGCDANTPVEPTSWGHIKALYR